MRLETVTAEIRPRSDWEAVDLGLAMVRRDFWRCFCTWWLAMILPVALTGWWLWDSPALWLFLFWWWKPAGSRMVLYQISRRLFGETPSWKDTLKEVPRAWVRRFFYRFIVARLSPWLPVTLAVEDLEGLRGRAYKQRSRQVTRRGEGVMMWIYFVAELASCWYGLAIVAVVVMFIPKDQDAAWRLAMENFDPSDPSMIPLLVLRVVCVCVMLAVSLTDVFVAGAGFGVYINNRTWIEGWDVELAFKRLAKRLTKVAVMLLVLAVALLPVVSRAEEPREPAKVIHEVKEDPAFKVHKVIDRVSKPKTKSSSWSWPSWLSFGLGSAAEWMGWMFMVSAVGILLGLIAWLVWKNRYSLWLRRGAIAEPDVKKMARVVMGMEVSPETLPADVPAAAWALWMAGRHQESLGLLYRGAISRVMEVGRVEIQESDTEGDCLRRVDQAGAVASPEYFRGITGTWMRMAYAGRRPDDSEVDSLCRQWPFQERRRA